jgi:hypothetical protein
MADQRIQYSEEMVGAGHPTKADTLNRRADVEHNTDGTHKAAALSSGIAALTAVQVRELLDAACFYRGTSAFAGPNGVTITHNLNTTDYHVIIEPTAAPGGLLGEISYTKSANTVVIYNSGAALTAFSYLLVKY